MSLPSGLATAARTAVAVAGGVLAGWFANWVVQRVRRSRRDGWIGRALAHIVGPPAVIVAFLIVAWAVLAGQPEDAAVGSVGYVLVVFALAVVADRLITEATTWRLARHAHPELHAGVAPMLRQVSRAVLVFLAATVVLAHFKVNVTGIITTAGVASLAFALAAQDTLANLFAGVAILFDRPFRPGHRVEIGALVGDVVEIGLRSTRIRTFDNNIVVIPNQQITAAQVTNRAYPDIKVALQVNVGVGYDTDLRQARGLMLEVAQACPDVLDEPPPAVYFTAFGDSSLQLQMWAYVGDYRRQFAALDALNQGVLDAFRRERIEIPFPQQVVTFKGPAAAAGVDPAP